MVSFTRSVCAAAALLCMASAAPSQDKRWDMSEHFWQAPSWRMSFLDVAKRTQSADKCNLQNAKMPAAPTALPTPAAGLHLYHVAIGRGTQNYTCDLSNSTAVPVAIGAVATLFNVSCIAANSPDLMQKLPELALNIPLSCLSGKNSVAHKDLSGHHYFTDLTTAYFDLDTAKHKYGRGAFKKVNATTAPADALVGVEGKGNGAVPWLKLNAKVEDTQTIQEVFRLETAGGAAPKTCQGAKAAFQVDYAAAYYFWSK